MLAQQARSLTERIFFRSDFRAIAFMEAERCRSLTACSLQPSGVSPITSSISLLTRACPLKYRKAAQSLCLKAEVLLFHLMTSGSSVKWLEGLYVQLGKHTLGGFPHTKTDGGCGILVIQKLMFMCADGMCFTSPFPFLSCKQQEVDGLFLVSVPQDIFFKITLLRSAESLQAWWHFPSHWSVD